MEETKQKKNKKKKRVMIEDTESPPGTPKVGLWRNSKWRVTSLEPIPHHL